jgi:hypothetical protein
MARNDIRKDVEEELIDLLPYILSGRYLRKQTFYRVHTLHAYTRDVLAIMIGLGLGFPGARIWESSFHPSESFGATLSSLPWYAWLPAVVLVASAAILKVYVTRESVERRAHLVDECETDFDVKYIEIVNALQLKNPLQKLASIRNNVASIVTHHTRARSYTFRGGWATGTNIEAKIQAKELCDSNERHWK